jgi:hypothetical protein
MAVSSLHMRRFTLCAALAVAFVGCKGRQANTENVPQPKSASLQGQEAEHAMVKAKPHLAAASERIASVMSRHPEPFLAFRPSGTIPPGTAPSLRPQVGKSFSFQTSIPGIQRWSDAHVGRFAVRLPNGVQESIPLDGADANRPVTYTFPTSGPAMLMFCAGPKGEAPTGSWFEVSHCSKLIVDVSDHRGRLDPSKDIGVTGETGLPIDVVPVLSPLGLTVGSVLPVSFHFMNEEQEEVEVAARRPDGTIDHQTTDSSGVAHFTLSQPGRWVIRLVKAEPKGERVGELVFEIAGSTR